MDTISRSFCSAFKNDLSEMWRGIDQEDTDLYQIGRDLDFIKMAMKSVRFELRDLHLFLDF